MGYWTDRTKNLCPGLLTVRYNALLDQLLTIFNDAIASVHDGAPMSDIDRIIRKGSMPRDIRGSLRIRLDMASERARTSRPIRISWRRERCRRAWCGLSNLEFTGRAAEACVWKTISW